MLSAVVEREGREAAVAMLESYFELLAGRMRARVGWAYRRQSGWASWPGSSPKRATWRRRGRAGATDRTEAMLTEHNCAIPAVAERFPEICAAEARYLADVLGAEVERTRHILSGCPACEYRVRFSRAAEERS